MKVLKRYILLLAAALLLSGCASMGEVSGQPIEEGPPAVQEEPAEEPAPPVEEVPVEEPEPPVEEPEIVPDPIKEDVAEVPVASAYDFTQPAPEREAVDNTYFADAAFVGDSRTDGFMIYSGIGTGKNLTSNGLSIFKLAEKKALKIGEKKYTLLEALGMGTYGKVYLCLGVNELGVYDDEGFYNSYLNAIDSIRDVQPDAIIYIQGLIPLNEGEIAATSGNTYLTNEHLRVYNDLMRKAAQEKQVVYLDLYTEFVDENGELPAGASRDGVHLNKEYCKRWLTYLQSHTVDPADLEMPQTENNEESAPV